MSWLIRALSALFLAPPLRWLVPRPGLGDRSSPSALAHSRRGTSLDSLAMFAPHDALGGCDVLDVGCGLGGRARAALRSGARHVVGVDVDPERIAWARRLAAERGSPRPSFAAASADALPARDESFDVVVLTEVLEHLDRPDAALEECQRVLRTGGRVMVSFPPYRSPWGGHLFDGVPIPWAHLVFPGRDLVDVWRSRFARRLERGSEYATVRQRRTIMEADRPDDLWNLNGLTIGRLLELLPPAGLELVSLKLKTPGDLPLWFPAKFREYLVTSVGVVAVKT